VAKRILTLTALAASLALGAVAAQATPGQLDPTFGSDGRVTTMIGSHLSDASAVVVQRDGKIVVGGKADFANLALARFKLNGALDSAFGSSGRVMTSLGSVDAAVYGLAIQPDRKIVAAGVDYPTQYESDFVVARYNPNGSLDSSFGNGGIVTTDFDRLDTGHAVVVQPDGTIVVAGEAIGPGGPTVAIARYRANGSLDPAFGSGGKVRSPVGIGAGTGLARQPDGKLVVSGTVPGNPGPQFALLRFHSNGSFDASFGSAGIAEAPVGSRSYPYGVALQADGKVVAAGNAEDSSRHYGWGVVRLNGDGTMDETFGHDGAVVTNTGANGGFAHDVAVQQNGKIVTAGYTPLEDPTDGTHTTVVRYEPNGDLDPRFGKNGIVNTNFGNVEYNYVAGLALQRDGKILVSGGAMNAGGPEVVALARFLGDTCLVPNVKRKTLAAAKRAITRAGCSPGKVRKAVSRKVARGRVISQRPAARASVVAGTKVSLVVSRGRRR
jgi:uncharacterized delta-60 repeat protein